MKKIFKLTLAAFSLLELSIVLIIIGVLASAALKGKSLIDSAKIQSVAIDFHKYKIIVDEYKNMYLALPGDDPNASSNFSDVQNGDGDGLISENEAKFFWHHLFKAGLVSNQNPPTSKLGGFFNPVSNPNIQLIGNWIALGNGEKSKLGILTPKQAQSLKSKMEDADASSGSLRFCEGEGAEKGSCIKDNKFNLDIDSTTCVAYLKIE